MAYHSRYSGEEVDSLLDKIKNDEVGSIDSSLSTTSENPVKNKVITKELNKKVDKVEGKQLSTEDFTSELKGKLDGLSNYDDTNLKGDLEVLKGKVDEKQDYIADLDSIRSGASKGSTAIQEHQDISHLLPKSDFETYATKTDSQLTELDSQIEAEATARTEADAALQTQINGKQEALTLTVKDNGNIVLANIQGQSKEFMPATPSGDPMHYAYVAAGAEYNDTGADIVKTTPWADMIDDDYTGDYGKTVVHKAGYWYLNGLGDFTNDEIRKIYQLTSTYPETVYLEERFKNLNIKTNFYNNKDISGKANIMALTFSSKFVVLVSKLYVVSNSILAFNCNTLLHIVGIIKDFIFSPLTFKDCNIITVKIMTLKANITIPSTNLSVKSVLYMINNEAATSPITITLHADVYNRCTANADILAALQAHTNVSLASA